MLFRRLVRELDNLREALAEGHERAFAWAVSCCGGNRSEAEDVLQTAYVRVISGKAQYQGRSQFRTWLFGVIHNVARERTRRGTRRMRLLRMRRPSPQATNAQAELTNAEERLQADEVRVALRTLSEKQQLVLHLVFYQGMTLEEAAMAMNISLGSARTHYHRGKTQLRERLSREEKP